MAGRAGRPTVEIVLTGQERAELERLARRHKSARDLAMRCRIVLAAADGLTNIKIAQKVGCHKVTAGRWRKQFNLERIDGLQDEPRPGAPRRITDEAVEEVITKTLESKPESATHWSTRQMADRVGMSQSTVGRIWRAFGLQPHKTKSFTLSNDPYFIDKVRDVVGLYLNPPDAAVAFCVDEKTQIQALDRTAPIFPMMPGTPEGHTCGYVRNGTTNLYAALDLATGNVISEMTTKHRSVEFRKFLNKIDAEVDKNLEVHIVLDNVSTHKSPMIKRWLQTHPRFTFHFTPTYSSWMNLVERWFSELTTKWLQRSAHRSTNELTDSINEWIHNWNENPTPYVWTKTADQILESLSGYMQRISDSGH
jgi:transposase